MKVKKLANIRNEFPNLSLDECVLYLDAYMDGYIEGLTDANESAIKILTGEDNEQDSEESIKGSNRSGTSDTPGDIS